MNACGGCATLSAKPGDLCGPGQYVVCKGSDATECKAGDGPPVSGLVATTNLEDKVTLSWTAPASLQPASYIILRDGAEWASTGVTKYDDESAEAAKVTAPSAVQASDGTAVDKVTVTWTPAASTPGKSYKYQVVGLYVQNGSTLKGLPSSEATGNRVAPPITGYEVQRDDGAWVPAGTGASFDDRLAPIGTLIGGNISSGALSRGPSAVVFGVVVEGQPAFTDAPPAKYTVRALTPAGNVVAATSDTGFRKKPVYEASKTTIKWQRSTVDADGSYVDLPGQTFAAGVDLTGPTDGSGRYYRPVVLFDGAPFPSTGTRATASAFKSVELFWDAGCGIRLDDTVTCWGNNNGNMVQGVPPGLKAKKVAVGSSHACAIRTDDTAVCWGSAADGRTTVPSGAIKDIAASDVGNCVVKSDNTLACNGAIGGSAAPAGAFKRVYRGVSAFCATKADDTTACWGIDNGGVVTNAPVAVKFKALAAAAQSAGLGDFEWMEGIPGNVGGSLRMNAGAMGWETFDQVVSVTLVDAHGSVFEKSVGDIRHYYRHVPELAHNVAVSAVFKGTPASDDEIAARMNASKHKRKNSQPVAASAGCVFKNPGPIGAGQLVDEMGLKNTARGAAKVSEVHGNFIVNEGGATAKDVLDLIAEIKAVARRERGVELETEVQIIGQDEPV